MTENNPLIESPPEEVPLPAAPLVRVIAQVRFAPILAVRQADFVAPFQEAIRAHYPMLREEHKQTIAFGPQGGVAGERQVTWQFADPDDSWRTSLSPEFVALETTVYSSRTDFIQRVRVLLEAVEEHLEPGFAVRVGLRYIDRVTGDALQRIARLVRPEMLGIVRTPLFEHAEYELSDLLLRLPDASGRIRARWGHLPAGATIDPTAIEPGDEKSWILDLDMFSTERRPFQAGPLADDLLRFAERIYAVFRWSVTDEFLRQYGGTP
ncbi:MAG: TIGR04255 family protein [Deltaproteobacteria bacterium]|nr:MAG: TIGR04255 family protein [Deltaproteobacteria bacterium]